MTLRRIVLLAALVPAAAGAQTVRPRVGDRVRVASPQTGYALVVGQVVAGDSLFMVKVAGPTGDYIVRRDQMTALDISGSAVHHTLPGLVIGGVVGGIIGLGDAVGHPTPAGSPQTGEDNVPRGTLRGAAIGGAIGGIVGFLVRTDVWVPVAVSSPSPSPSAAGAARTRLSLGLSFAF